MIILSMFPDPIAVATSSFLSSDLYGFPSGTNSISYDAARVAKSGRAASLTLCPRCFNRTASETKGWVSPMAPMVSSDMFNFRPTVRP